MFEALTLIQTGKIYHVPVVLFRREYWQGLIDWMRSTVIAGKKISATDLDLMLLTDDPNEATQAVIAASGAQIKHAKKRVVTNAPKAKKRR